jgi:hypothetical protein
MHISEATGLEYDQYYYYYFVSLTPPPCSHRVILENLYVSNERDYDVSLGALVKKEHLVISDTISRIADDFDICSPIFTFLRDLTKFAKKEIGLNWKETHAIMWFLTQYHVPVDHQVK